MTTHETNASATTTTSTATSTTTSGNGLLWAMGAAACCAGVAIATLPHVSYRAGQLAAGLGAHGAIGASVFTGGALLLALGWTKRSSARTNTNDSTTTLLLEQLATDLAQTRATLDTLQQQMADTAQCTLAVREELSNARGNGEVLSPTEAMFQLAASLDKLGARIDQKLKVHHTTLHEGIEELGTTLAHTQRTLEERLHALESNGTFHTSNTTTTTIGGFGNETTGCCSNETTSSCGTNDSTTNTGTNTTSGTGSLQLASNGWNHDEWTTTTTSTNTTHGTEEVSCWDVSEGSTETGALGSLGVLDSFGDETVPSALPQSTSQETSCDATLDFDALDANTDALTRELAATSRANQQGSSTGDTTPTLDTVPGVTDVAAKLSQLQALLADPALAALLGQSRTR